MSDTYQMVIVHVPTNTTWKSKPEVYTLEDLRDREYSLLKVIEEQTGLYYTTSDDQFMVISSELLKNCTVTLRKLVC